MDPVVVSASQGERDESNAAAPKFRPDPCSEMQENWLIGKFDNK